MLLIVNPISGTKHIPSLGHKLLGQLRSRGFDVEMRLTEYGGHAREIAADAVRDGEDAVLACGGDGTINEVASALAGSTTTLGILPNGSGNGLARHIGIPCDPLRALDIISAGVVRNCDWCDASGMSFFCAFGVGFDAAVAHRFALSKSRGLTTYLRSALEEIRDYKPKRYKVSTDDGSVWEGEAMLISVCNASQLGNNAYMAPHASIADGKMDITVVEKSNMFRYTQLGINLMGASLRESSGLKMLSAKEVVISREDEGPVHIDGEPKMLGRDIRVKVHPGELRIFINPFRRDVKPWLTPLHLG